MKVVKVKSKDENKGSNKEELKNHIVQFRMIVWHGPEEGFVQQAKENLQFDFAWTCENFTQLWEMVQKVVKVVFTSFISHDHAKLVFFMRNGYFAD